MEKKPLWLLTKEKSYYWLMWHPSADLPAKRQRARRASSVLQGQGLGDLWISRNQFGGRNQARSLKLKSFAQPSLGYPFRCTQKSK